MNMFKNKKQDKIELTTVVLHLPESKDKPLSIQVESIDPSQITKRQVNKGKLENHILLPKAPWATPEAIKALNDFVQNKEVKSTKNLSDAMQIVATIGAHKLADRIAKEVDERLKNDDEVTFVKTTFKK